MGLDPRCVGLKGSPTIVAKITFTPEVPRKKIVYKPKDGEDAARWLIEQLLKDEKASKVIRRALADP